MFDRDIVTSRLTEVFHQVFDDDSISLRDDTTAKDIDEWDSLTHISLVLAVEKEFGLRLSAAEVGGLANVGSMINLLMVRSTK